jgi:hypothetical protein
LKNGFLCLPGLNRLMGNWTGFDATTAPGAAGHIDASGALFDFHLEIARRPFHRFQVRIGDQFDVQMPADLDQFWRNDSHGTVVGGKGFVQLGHSATNGWALFQEVYVIARVGEIQGRLHARNTAPHHQYGTLYFFSH